MHKAIVMTQQLFKRKAGTAVWTLHLIFILHIIHLFQILLFLYARSQDYWRSYVWAPKASNHNDCPWEKLCSWNNNWFIESHFIDLSYLKFAECIISLLGAFVELRKTIISFVTSVWPSVCPHGTTRFPKNGFSWNLTFEYVSKNLSRKFVFRYNWTILRVLYIETDINLGSSVAQLYLQWDMLQTKFAEKIKTRISCSKIFFLNRALYETVVKNCTVEQVTDGNITHVHCVLDTFLQTQSQNM